MQNTPKWKIAVTIWLAIYPTITTYFWLLSPWLANFPFPLKTLCLTICVVPTMVWVMLPFVQRLLKNWLRA